MSSVKMLKNRHQLYGSHMKTIRVILARQTELTDRRQNELAGIARSES